MSSSISAATIRLPLSKSRADNLTMATTRPILQAVSAEASRSSRSAQVRTKSNHQRPPSRLSRSESKPEGHLLHLTDTPEWSLSCLSQSESKPRGLSFRTSYPCHFRPHAVSAEASQGLEIKCWYDRIRRMSNLGQSR